MEISIYQERFLLEWLLNPNSSKGNVSISYKLDKSVNLEYLKQSCIYALDDENFHMAFTKDNKPYLKNYAPDDFIKEYEYKGSDEGIKDYISNLVDTPFDLYNGPLCRFNIIFTKTDTYFIFLSYHILSDGVTVKTIKSRIEQAYKQMIKEEEIRLPKQNFNGAIKKENSFISSCKKEDSKKYWIDFLEKSPLSVDFPLRLSGSDSLKNGSIYFELEGEEYAKLKNAIKKSKTTLFIYLCAVYTIALSKYSNQDEILLSYPIDLRPKGYQDVCGSFINNVLLKANIDFNQSFKDFISTFNKQRKSSKHHQWYSMSELVRDLRQDRADDLGENFFNMGIGEAVFSSNPLTLDGVKNEGLVEASWRKESDFLLNLLFDSTSHKDKILFQLEYQKEKIDLNLISQFIDFFKTILRSLSLNQELLLKDLQNKEQYDQLLIDVNNTQDKEILNSIKPLHELFEDQVSLTPDATAVIDSSGTYSYKYLSEYSNYLAYSLKDIKSDGIAIYTQKGCFQPLSAMGVLKAGKFFLPFGDWPLSRIDDVLAESKVDTILVSSKNEKSLEGLKDKYTILVIEDLLTPCKMDGFKFPQVSPNDLAYVIYTSGSTGKPKGVMASHKGVANTVLAVNKRFDISSEDSAFAISEFSFDLSDYDIFGMLSSGASILYPDSDKREDTAYWCELISKYKPSIWNSVPQLAELLYNEAASSGIKLDLKAVLMSGDYIPLSLPTKIKEDNKNTITMSLGGATEGTIWSIWYEIEAVDKNWSTIPYGVPMPNQGIYVLDNSLEPAHVGVIGDLYITGVSVSPGYFNNKKRTDESFINHPTLGYIYKTGDLGVLSSNGYYQFKGRSDNQVKINGYRIELEEIEAVISKYEDIKQVVVLAKEKNNNKYLVAYYTNKKDINEQELNKYLSKELPKYMIPTIYKQVDEFKLTTNGKLDIKALPEPELKGENYIAPNTQIEKDLCDIFKEVLKVEEVGIKDDFFRIGGDSIHSIGLVRNINEKLMVNMSVSSLMEHKTVEQLALIVSSGIAQSEVIEMGEL